ncbi:MAG: L-methionine gamma-lyase [Pseudomonas fluorescens]|nr:MAG: L-methionine gamma-lyase [Pseudomonas fluorescens]
MKNKHNTFGFSTRAIHHGYDPQAHHGALVPPTYLSATFAFSTAEYGAACFAGEENGHFYTRISNPTLALLESRMASLENGDAAVAFSSGMGAIAATFWTLLRPGDEVIVSQTLYGCTFALLHHGIGEFGIKVRHVDLTDPAALREALSPATRNLLRKPGQSHPATGGYCGRGQNRPSATGLRIPRSFGHSVHQHLDSDSTLTWTPIPRSFGHF